MRSPEAPLEPGDAFGPYVIVARAGTGGMGEVYKARDTRLDRSVALKVIGSGLGDRREFRQRFAAEARAIAALNHPHICSLYDTGHHEGRDFLVLEYLEGETLAQRLRRGPLPVHELLGYATEIAEALDYAHRQGVVHRDLKPANVLLTRQGGAKLLDFGIAKLRATTSHSDGVSGLPTRPQVVTTEGAIVGTLHYLAPERLDGREADARSDVFAFGAVLYEMATGRKAFDEKSQARLIASILTADPAPIDTSSGLPPDLQWIVQNCVSKDPDARWQSMGDVAKVLKAIARSAREVSPPANPRRPWILVGAAALGGAILVGALSLWPFPVSDRGAVRGPISLSVLPPVGGTFALTESSVRTAQFAVAPDGHAIVFMATGEGGRQLWFRELGLTEPRPIAGTTGASYPFWSADSRFVGFFADRVLKKVGLTGLAPLALCDAQNGRGGAWREDGTVVFAPDTSSPLYRVDDAGGAPVPLTTLGAKHSAHRWPQFLPDGRILFFARSAEPEAQGIYVTSVDRPHEVHPVRAAATSGLYASGQLLFVLDGELMAQPLDARTLRLSSEAVPLGLKVSVSSSLNSAVSTSNQGVLATWSSAATISELVWFDARGTRLGTAGRPDRYVDFRLSPDDRRVALSRVAPATNTPDLAILNLDNEGLTAIASSSQTDASPVWSADGTRLVFRSNRFRDHDLFERPAHGGGADRFLHSTGFGMYPTDWSADGLILFHMLSKSTRHDIWALDAGNSLREVLRTAASEMQGQLAPGGRLVYTSDASGAIEVYVGALTGGKGPVNVSVNGGFDPRWRADGRELFFISAEGMLMAAEVSGDRTIRVGPARPLFQTPIHGTNPPYLSNFAVTRDGRRFLINVPAQPPGAGPITITMDWLRRVNVDVR